MRRFMFSSLSRKNNYRRCVARSSRSSAQAALVMSVLFGTATGLVTAQALAANFERVCTGTNDQAPVFITRDPSGTLERLEVFFVDANTGQSANYGKARNPLSIRGRYVAVSIDDVTAVCRSGISVAVMPKPRSSLPNFGNTPKAGVDPAATVPPSFTIQTVAACKQGLGCTTTVWGNFWVPGVMPGYHNAHLSQFTVTASNFHNAPNNGHFVHSLLTVSDTNLVADFDGKGMIFGYDTTYCGNGSPTYGSVAETWVIQNPPPPYPGNKVRVFNGIGLEIPNTCSPMTPNDTYRFLVGANRQQQSQFYRYHGASMTPDYPPPGSNFDAYVVNSLHPYFRGGGAGVAFFVAGGNQATPVYPLIQWSLTFTGVSTWTQP